MAKKQEQSETTPETTEVVKRELEHIAGIKPDDGKEYLHTNIGFDRGAPTKYEVYWVLPVTDIRDELIALSDECKARYDCDLIALIESGVRQLTTRPDYKSVGFFEDGILKEDGHANMQAMADNYKVGARVASEGIKSKAKKFDSLMQSAGVSSEAELRAKMAKMAELEAQGLL